MGPAYGPVAREMEGGVNRMLAFPDSISISSAGHRASIKAEISPQTAEKRDEFRRGSYARRSVGICVALSLFAFVGRAAADSVFSPTSGPSCLDQSDEGVRAWRCPGPGGYVVEFSDEGNWVGIGFAKGRLRGPPVDSVASGEGVGKSSATSCNGDARWQAWSGDHTHLAYRHEQGW
jgi:hypothetical protein